MSEKRVKATLKLQVTYSGQDADELICSGVLEDLVKFASNRGLLSGEYDMIVDDFVYETICEPQPGGDAK